MDMVKLSPLITEKQISDRIKVLGKELTEKFKGDKIVAVGVLNGSFMFFSDLIREIDTDVICDFCGVSSYSNAITSSGEVKITLDLNSSVKGKNVVIIEDIVDTGLTMNFLKAHIESRGPKSITTASLLLKPQALKVKCPMDYVGFEIANDFVVGYGLDYQGLYRNLPYIAQIQNIN